MKADGNRQYSAMDRHIRKEFVLCCVAGSIVTATDFSIYYVLFHFFAYNISKGISFTCAGVLGYVLYKYWIFKRNQTSLAEAVRYVFINSLALGLNVVINQEALIHWPGHVLMALVMATAFTGLFNFVLFKWWVFGPKSNQKELNPEEVHGRSFHNQH